MLLTYRPNLFSCHPALRTNKSYQKTEKVTSIYIRIRMHACVFKSPKGPPPPVSYAETPGGLAWHGMGTDALFSVTLPQYAVCAVRIFDPLSSVSSCIQHTEFANSITAVVTKNMHDLCMHIISPYHCTTVVAFSGTEQLLRNTRCNKIDDPSQHLPKQPGFVFIFSSPVIISWVFNSGQHFGNPDHERRKYKATMGECDLILGGNKLLLHPIHAYTYVCVSYVHCAHRRTGHSQKKR